MNGTPEKVICKMKFTVYKVRLDLPSDQIPVTLDDDLVRYQWVDPTELKNVKLTPPSVALFQRLGYL